ncbi:MAG: metallophosphoesterase [Gammaproteobacteria bacterium]|nr:metallophosphoesterase [Gammaproteobacteria bacterium]
MPVKTWNRQIVIGDVHGCLEELQQLVSNLHLTADDEVIFVGDLIDKGPKSAGVVNWLGNISKLHSVQLIEGNHEERFLRWYATLQKNPEKAAQFAPRQQFSELLAELEPAGIEILQQSRLWYRLQQHDYIVVHAGVPEYMQQLPPVYPRDSNGTAKARKHWYQTQHIRYINDEGKPVCLEQEKPDHHFWAEGYDGRFGVIIFGHQVWPKRDGPRRFEHAIGVDLGCVHGGALCAWIMEKDGRTSWQCVDSMCCYQPLHDTRQIVTVQTPSPDLPLPAGEGRGEG